MIDKSELHEQVAVSRKLGRVTHSLGVILIRITDITMKKYFSTMPPHAFDDMASDITCALLEQTRQMKLYNPNKTFAFLLNKARYTGLDVLKRTDRHEYTDTLDEVLSTDFTLLDNKWGEDKHFYSHNLHRVYPPLKDV